jgi:hypothetical protein
MNDIATQARQMGCTYASTQATKCAGCGEYKHTPLRNDEMGGYVCLTCIDRELERLQLAGGRQPDAAKTPDESTLASATLLGASFERVMAHETGATCVSTGRPEKADAGAKSSDDVKVYPMRETGSVSTLKAPNK